MIHRLPPPPPPPPPPPVSVSGASDPGQGTAALAALLRWYGEVGVDLAVGEEAIDRFALADRVAETARLAREAGAATRMRHPAAEPAPQADARERDARGRDGAGPRPVNAHKAPPARPTPPPWPQTAPPAVPSWSDPRPEGAGVRLAAQHQAAAAGSLDALKAVVDGFRDSPLRRMATSTVFADGNPQSGVMLVGEAPGAEEDRLGLPFVGASGRLLDAMLASIGLDRRLCYITNVVPWRPPGNRKPTADEVAQCLPFLEQHIALVAPRVLLALGGLAAQALLSRTEGITRLRGQWQQYSRPPLTRPVPVLATFHPAYLLRTPAQKRLAWHDLLSLRRVLDGREDPQPHPHQP